MFDVLVELLVQVIGGITGHLLLWTATFGRWKLDTRVNGNIDEIAIIVGLLFWATVGVAIWYFFFR